MPKFLGAALGLALVAGWLAASPAAADDLFPPPWRGQPNTTFGLWEFYTPNPSPLPDEGHYPFGPPSMAIYPGVGQVWQSEWNGRTGVWPLSGEIWLGIPNSPIQRPWKDIHIQLTWGPQAPGNTPIVMSTQPISVPGTLVQTTPLGSGWFHSVYTIRLEPNPSWEQILITGGIDVDELVVDTICIPEPATLGLLGLGLVAIWRRRS